MTEAPKFRFTTGREMVQTTRGVKRCRPGSLVHEIEVFETPDDAVRSLRGDLRSVHVALGHGGGRTSGAALMVADYCLREPCTYIRSKIREIESAQPPPAVQ